jgi:hypothetical protein
MAEEYLSTDPSAGLAADEEYLSTDFGAGYETTLTPEQEQQFQDWKAKYAPKDSGEDYDLRGAFQAGLTPDPETGHWPDTFKKPNHPTFSDQSIYAQAAPQLAGHWEGDKFVPPSKEGPKETSALPPFLRGVARGGSGVGAGLATAWALETPIAAAAAGASAVGTPLAGAAVEVLGNLGAFLGGMIIGNKIYDKGEEAIAEHSDLVKQVKESVKEHPTAEQIGELLPMAPMLAKSITGYASLAKDAKSVSEAAKVVGTRAIASGAAGLGAEQMRPVLEQGINTVGQAMGFQPDQIQKPTVRSRIENTLMGMALGGQIKRSAPVEAPAEAPPAEEAPPTSTAIVPVAQAGPRGFTLGGEPLEARPELAPTPPFQETIARAGENLSPWSGQAFFPEASVPGIPQETARYGALEGEAAVAEGRAETLRRSGLPVPDAHQQQIDGLNGEMDALEPAVRVKSGVTQVPTDGQAVVNDAAILGNNNAAYAKIFGEETPESNLGLNPEQLKARGRADKARGVRAADIAKVFNDTGLIGERGFGVALTEFDDLHMLSVAADELARKNPTPENQAAAKIAYDNKRAWADVVQKMKGAPSQMFRNLQGMVPVDYSTLSGVRDQMIDTNGHDILPKDTPKFQKLADNVTKGNDQFRNAVNAVDEVVKKTPSKARLRTAQDFQAYVADLLKC